MSEPGLVTQVGLGIGLFTAIVLILVFVILLARSRLVASGSAAVLTSRVEQGPASAAVGDANVSVCRASRSASRRDRPR